MNTVRLVNIESPHARCSYKLWGSVAASRARPASGNALGQRAVTAAEIEYGLVGRWGEKIQNLGAKVRDETRNCARIRLRPMLAPRRRIGHIAEDIRNKRPRARPFVSAEGQ